MEVMVMGWAQRLNRLPLKFHTAHPEDLFGLKSEECLEGRTKGATYKATRTYIPTQGIVYAFSFGGSESGRRHLIKEITKELGSPIASDHILDPNVWMYFWKATFQEIPKTDVHKVLGEERINEICRQHGLDENDRKTVDVYLATLRATMGIEWSTRENAIAYALQSLPPDKLTKISSAVLQITQEFAAKRHPRNN